MLVSIVLPMLDDEDTVEECLSSLRNQSYNPKEIIAIDDGSSDRTYEIAERIARKSQSISAVRIEHHGRSYARNFGTRLARGELVFFAESDAKYSSDYLAKAVGGFSDPKVGGVLMGGGVWEDDTYMSRCMHLEALLRNVDLNSGRIHPESGWVYRRDIFDVIGGFDEQLNAGEDTDLGIRVRESGYRIRWMGGMHWWFKNPKTLRELIRRSYWFGKEELGGFFRKYPYRFPWAKVSVVLFSVILLVLSLLEKWTLFVLIIGIVSIFLIKGISILRKGWKFLGIGDAVSLVLLSAVRNISFLLGVGAGLAKMISNQ